MTTVVLIIYWALMFVGWVMVTALWLDQRIKTELLHGSYVGKDKVYIHVQHTWWRWSWIGFYECFPARQVVEGGHRRVWSLRIRFDLHRLHGDLLWDKALRDIQ